MSPDAYTSEFSASEQALIDKEFMRLQDSTYLDHAGSTLYAASQVADAALQLQRDVICNPHTCRGTGDYIDQVRYKILEFFNTDAEHYSVVFTANATAALRLVAEHFEFAGGDFHYCLENHTSVLGMRELVKAKRIRTLSHAEMLSNRQTAAKPRPAPAQSNSLVVFSAQCNFSGYKMPLNIIKNIQQAGLAHLGNCIWTAPGAAEATQPADPDYYVCLDAAAFAATNHLDLAHYQPDYVCISFYKIFGYPTGVGALLVSRRGAAQLRKRFYGGGTIKYAYAHSMEHQLRDAFHERFEDGTLPFLSIAELLQGFRTLERLVPRSAKLHSMERVSRHVHALANYCQQQLRLLLHQNDAPLVSFYNHTGYEDRRSQGGVVAFNVRTDCGGYVGFGEIACVAALQRILLRTGCFCNIGACQHHLGLDDDAMDAIYKRAGRVCGDYYDLLDGRPTGAVRVSFGYMTRLADVQRLVEMLRSCYIAAKPQQRLRFIEQQADQLPLVLQRRAKQLRPRVLELAIYPVKSCAAFKIPNTKRWPLTAQGLQYDRQWMIVDMNGLALTQKKCTELCLLQPRIVGEQLELYFNGAAAHMTVPLSLEATAANSARCRSKVCRQPIEGFDCGDQVADWLSQMLGLPGLRLLRQCAQRVAPAANGEVAALSQLSLVNQAQFLLVNRASVRSLQFDEPLEETVNRFRANIVTETDVPFEELHFTQLSIAGIKFRVDGPCQRCDMICINQRTGERSPETLTTLARMQRGKMRFGIYISREESGAGDEQLHLACDDAIEASSDNQ